MPSGRASKFADLPSKIHSYVESERRAIMTTIAKDGSPHSVPVVFALLGDELISPIDHKPKSGEIMQRVKNIGRDDRVTLLIDHWDEDWTQVGWLMVRGVARVDEEAALDDMRVLNERYEQYDPDERHDALIRIRPARLSWWAWTDPAL